ncbi:MAG: LacI family transcriptional regulator [Spirochaetaceae bacterium]|nr:LacI family transcriptional regulator [Spirochaetaceae bacterium]
MPVTIVDIAQKADVSISTVSNVINGRKNVGIRTRRRVLKICEELNYVPNIMGKSLRVTRTKSILFNFSDFDRSFYLKIIEGINECAKEHDYDLFICTTRSCEKHLHTNLTDGAIILDSRMKNETLIRAANEKYPVIVLDRHIFQPFFQNITVNNYDPMKEMVQSLVAAGRAKFAFVAGLEHTDDTRERRAAFLDALAENGLVFSDGSYFSGDYREASGYNAAKTLAEQNNIPDALVCANDNMAIGAIKALREHGIPVGAAGVAVTGFDDTEAAENIGLTTVAIPNYERGYCAAKALIANIEGQNDYRPITIQAEIKWRASALR